MSSDTVTKDAVLLHCHTLCPANVANTGTACRAHGWGAGTVHGWGAGTVHGWGAGTAGSRRRGAALAGWWRGAVGAEAQARSPGAKDGTMHVEGKAGLRLAPAARPNRPASAAPLRYPGHLSPGPASRGVGGTLHRPACGAPGPPGAGVGARRWPGGGVGRWGPKRKPAPRMPRTGQWMWRERRACAWPPLPGPTARPAPRPYDTPAIYRPDPHRVVWVGPCIAPPVGHRDRREPA